MGCCDAEGRKEDVRTTVRRGCARIADGGGSCCGEDSCCSPAPGPEALARKVGYREEELAGLPEGANMGLSCGNPTAMASLEPGETVLDLGSGGGFDVFIAARRVGPQGRAIGVDMTPEMVSKARHNLEAFRASGGPDNVEFRLGEIEHLPLADRSVDCVISNCVINLSPDKPQVWREVARVLRPGGRVAVSDLALLRELPEAVRESAEALVSCIAGAALVGDTERMAREAGLTDVTTETRPVFGDEGAYGSFAELLPKGTTLSDYIVSMDLRARRPSAARATT